LLSALSRAAARGVLVSVILPPNGTAALSAAAVTNVTADPNASANFFVIDDSAYLAAHLFETGNYSQVLFTQLANGCPDAIADIVSFFNFRYRNLTAKARPAILPLSSHAKTSLIAPLKISDTNQTLYFFHNPGDLGEPVRIASGDFLPLTFYLSAGAGVAANTNISIFCDKIPSPAGVDSFSLFKVIKRVLITLTNSGGHACLRFLVPERWASLDESRWLNSTAAFDKADVRLYNSTWEGSNFIVVANRVFLFSHSLDDASFQRLGFHLSTNHTAVFHTLSGFWDSVWWNATRYNLH
jgi:hypothetical protein